MEDAQIVELYWKRDETAITESRKAYSQLLGRISYNILYNREDSEECVSDTYIKAWQSIPPQKPEKLSAYLCRIVRNLSINRYHENHAQKRSSGENILLSELEECLPSGGGVDEDFEIMHLSEQISAWLQTLMKEDRVLFLRRYFYADSLKTLAGECGTSENKLAGRLFRLRAKLKIYLQKEGVNI